MKIIETSIEDLNKFEYNDIQYDCSPVIERDMELIYQEAEYSHKGVIDELYKRESLRASRVKLYLDDNDTLLYIMIVYLIDYKKGNNSRLACGDYYPVSDKNTIYPHPYQTSICW